ncbi:hypothetical protein CONPUDRAFT_85606 [Coniophora puteana RWD-64-598 SS2]|uniref:Uncharacterized protein n=1 Tax=Coniophora puteana (strain RWD-64-598) TaxID=741705 RepID=A0A5M3M611_CONPW|nr:uncharacterized protein CONPUDRAFT_85606 [Coniophora puteana RWD-64-598 SS2]EIW74818.1 hypothetical protein CONPUDRAFT_85606 [Coniophora puteana RWD-64-598 SS2]
MSQSIDIDLQGVDLVSACRGPAPGTLCNLPTGMQPRRTKCTATVHVQGRRGRSDRILRA